MYLKSESMKLNFLFIITFLTFKINANPPKFQYCVAYCIREDTIYDAAHKAVFNNGVISMRCAEYIYELHNGECPAVSSQGLNSQLSPTQCYRLKNYNGLLNSGDGSKSYKDGSGLEWTYYNIARNGESDNPKAFISYAKKTGEYCLEIPLLKYKILLFNRKESPVKEGYYERMQFDGSRLISETIRSSLPKEPTNAPESRITYDFKFLFDDYRNNFIITNPNPFDREIKVMIAKEIADSNYNLVLVLKDNIGNKVVVQNVENGYATLSTVMVAPGKYILFLLRNEEILEYRQVIK